MCVREIREWMEGGCGRSVFGVGGPRSVGLGWRQEGGAGYGGRAAAL